MVNPIDDPPLAFVPSVHYLLGGERCFVDKLCQDKLEVIVAFIEDAIDYSSPTTSRW